MEFYWRSVDATLKNFPNLRARIPAKWPRCITVEQVAGYDRHRTDNLWDHMNLWTLAFTLQNINDKRTCSLYESILADLEWFATEMMILPKAASTLRPLWQNSWNVRDDAFWSVLSEIKLAQLMLKKNGKYSDFTRRLAPLRKMRTSSGIEKETNATWILKHAL
jgi:hypothetical protein